MLIKLLTAATFLLFFLPLSAQVTIFAPVLYQKHGDFVDVDVKGTNFNKIVDMQFTLRWDPGVLEFVEVKNFNLPGLQATNFGLNGINSGFLTYVWFDATLQGVSLPDSAQVYSVRFLVTGQNGDSSNVVFSDTPTAIEVADSTGVINAVFHDGLIKIDMMNDAAIPETKTTFYQNFPNPFTDETQIPFELTSPDTVTLSIFDATGKKIYEKGELYNTGIHFVKINNEIIPAEGMYYYRLATTTQYSSKAMIKH